MDPIDVARFSDAAPGLLRRLLRTGGTYADAFYEHTLVRRHDLRQRLTGRHLNAPQRRQQGHTVHGTGLRALDGSAQGFASADGFDAEAVRDAADRAAAQVAAPGSVRPAAPLATAPPPPAAAPPPSPEALVEAAADAAFSLDDAVRHVRVVWQHRLRRVALATSEGVLAAWAQPLTGLRVEVMLASETGEVTAHAVAGGTAPLDVRDAETGAREAVRQAHMLASAQPLRGGTMPVVLAAGWGGVWLHEAVGHLLEADVLDGGPYAGRLGRRVAPADVTLVDDGTLAAGRATAPRDDEGTVAQRTMLIDGGRLVGVLTDRRHRPAGLSLSGNARRQDYRHAPMPRMTNLCLLDGTATPDDLIGSIDDGLFIEMLGGGRVWPERHRFTFDVLVGRRIEHGRLTHPVSGVRVSGRVTDALAHLHTGDDARLDVARGVCAKQRQSVPVSVSMPTVRLDGMQVSQQT